MSRRRLHTGVEALLGLDRVGHLLVDEEEMGQARRELEALLGERIDQAAAQRLEMAGWQMAAMTVDAAGAVLEDPQVEVRLEMVEVAEKGPHRQLSRLSAKVVATAGGKQEIDWYRAGRPAWSVNTPEEVASHAQAVADVVCGELADRQGRAGELLGVIGEGAAARRISARLEAAAEQMAAAEEMLGGAALRGLERAGREEQAEVVRAMAEEWEGGVSELVEAAGRVAEQRGG